MWLWLLLAPELMSAAVQEGRAALKLGLITHSLWPIWEICCSWLLGWAASCGILRKCLAGKLKEGWWEYLPLPFFEQTNGIIWGAALLCLFGISPCLLDPSFVPAGQLLGDCFLCLGWYKYQAKLTSLGNRLWKMFPEVSWQLKFPYHFFLPTRTSSWDVFL